MKPMVAAALGLAAMLALFPTLPAAAQDAAAPAMDEPAVEPGPGEPSPIEVEEATSASPFLPGEQTISLATGLHIPLFILPDTRTVDESKLDLGGDFSFGYQYFIARSLAIGGTISGAFTSTIGDRSLFVAPISFRAAYWWSLLPFELCAAAEAGGYIMRLGDYGMLGPFAKVGGGAFWRGASAWSVGLQTYLWLVPEVHFGDYVDETRTGGFLEVSICAVYHL